ncbi:uncharacterized protein LOC111704677 [Eurytemora carolleeae]|uniref:uncharacterized protein LOC111704677 n=1 Tax=Eurytemora carolleeae TaxID=1294199 RepID=UPI000C768373|nr:uncharacterized protein LOC111704677 [Eurytemora carolleeae]|eukprot:XP_023332759.1 uncharacterized protein LOC111704677 [Eurytemora affinis]
MVKEFLSKYGGQLLYDWEGVCVVNNQADKDAWRETIQPGRRRNTNRTRPQHKNWDEKRPNTHAFKAPPIRRFKTKDEMDTGSEIANCGGSTAGSISGVSSLCSRTHSRSSGYSDASGSALKRTWFNSAHGGLRVKTEIKTEYNEFDESGGFISKRIKFES